MYEGGYKHYKTNLRLKNNKVKLIELKEKGLKLINDYQQTKYELNTNVMVIKLIKQYENYLYTKIKEAKLKIQTYYDEKEAESEVIYKKDIFLYKLENLLEEWYILQQYLILIESKMNKIYYIFELDFRGRIYNKVYYGLNPTTSKLSRYLINLGERELTVEGKKNLKKYIYNRLNITKEEEFEKALRSVSEMLNTEMIGLPEETFNKIEEKILLIDWLTKVEKENKTEILIEMDANQSGFQMLSMFSNDEKGMLRTKLIESKNEEKDLYEDIYERIIKEISKEEEHITMISKKHKKEYKFKVSKENLQIINRKLIKKIVMTVPYGSKVKGQVEMLLTEFNKNYGLKLLFEKNEMHKILECKIIKSETIKTKIKEFNNLIISGKYVGLKDFRIYEQIAHYQAWLDMDLKTSFFRVISKLIDKEVKIEYPKIVKYVQNLKKDLKTNIKKYEELETEYFKVSLIYKLIKEYEYTVQNKKYKTYIIKEKEKDLRKSIQALTANICHSIGDAFIIYKIIDMLNIKGIRCYTIHDALLCHPNDVKEVQEEVLKSYKYVYNYIIQENIFNFVKRERIYDFNSLKIMGIK
jgi:hypothetical protein